MYEHALAWLMSLLVFFVLTESARSKGKPKCKNGYLCRNATNICINQEDDCDGVPGCPLWDDELGCGKGNYSKYA